VSGPLDSLVRIRLLLFDRTLADTSRAATEVRKAREYLEMHNDNLALIEENRGAALKQLDDLRDARWLAQLWAFDRRLTEDLVQARQEAQQAQSGLSGRQEDLSKSKAELALAQAKLQIAKNLERRRRRAAIRRRELRSV
jgi:flagellar biosynthesis chaperone FliJ